MSDYVDPERPHTVEEFHAYCQRHAGNIYIRDNLDDGKGLRRFSLEELPEERRAYWLALWERWFLECGRYPVRFVP